MRFGEGLTSIYVTGELIDRQHIRVHVPKYTKPDVLYVEISTNGEDFTNDKATYGYFDPFVVSSYPNLISPDGTTKVNITGFGFVNSESGAVKVKFSSRTKGELSCNGMTPCVVQGTFIDKNTVHAVSLQQASLTYADSGEPVGTEPITVEVSVYDDIFTENKVQVYYYKPFEFKEPAFPSVPSNMQHPIMVETDFHWKHNDIATVTKH